MDWRFEAAVTKGRTLYAVSPSQDSLCEITFVEGTCLEVAKIPAPRDITWDCEKKNLYIAGLGGIWKYDTLTEQCHTFETFKQPSSIRFSKQGDLFLCDSGLLIKMDMKTREVTTVLEAPEIRNCLVDDSGTIYFTTKTGIFSFHNGETTLLVPANGPLSIANAWFPTHLEFDTDGGILFSDFRCHQIKKLDLQQGILYTVAGTGRVGTVDGDVVYPYATLEYPVGLYRDDQSHQLYIISLHPGGTFIRVLHPTFAPWDMQRLFWIARHKNEASECPVAMLPRDIIRLIIPLCAIEMPQPKLQYMPLPPVDRILKVLLETRKKEWPDQPEMWPLPEPQEDPPRKKRKPAPNQETKKQKMQRVSRKHHIIKKLLQKHKQ